MVDIEELVSRGVDGLEVPNGHAIHPLLQPLFPGGLMPAVYRLDGASSVGLGLLTHGWCGVVGLPELSVEAARQWGGWGPVGLPVLEHGEQDITASA